MYAGMNNLYFIKNGIHQINYNYGTSVTVTETSGFDAKFSSFNPSAIARHSIIFNQNLTEYLGLGKRLKIVAQAITASSSTSLKLASYNTSAPSTAAQGNIIDSTILDKTQASTVYFELDKIITTAYPYLGLRNSTTSTIEYNILEISIVN